MEQVSMEEQADPWFKALRVILYAVLAMPILIWSIFLFPFITTKVIYFRLVIELALVIYLLLAARYPELRPRWDLLTKLVWIYLGVMIVTSLFGVNISKSFFGTIERGEGIITLLHFVVYFTILTAVLRTARDWYRYLLAAVTTTFLSALVGLTQVFGYPVVQAQGSRISGTIGNAAFFAAFMIFGVFLSLLLLRRVDEFAPQKARLLKVYLRLVLFIELFAIYHSQTRGAILALLAAFFWYGLVAIFKSQSRRARLAAGAGAVLIIAAALGVWLGRDSQFIRGQETLKRLATISPTDITTQSRFDTWQASWQGWQDRFILGYGYENFNIAFNKYFPARIFKDQGSQIWFDRAHNVIFDIGVTSGIIGLLAYLGLLAVALWYLWRPSSDQNWQDSALLSGLLMAYFLQNFFVFDTHATYLFFFLLLAYIVFLKVQSQAPAPALKLRQYRPGFGLVTVLAVVTAVAAYFVNLEPALANYQTTNGIRAALVKQYRQVRSEFEKALSHGTYMDEEIRQRLVDYANEAVISGQLSRVEQAELYEYVISELQKSLQESPRDVRNYNYLMSVLNRAVPYNPAYADEVFALGLRALELSPTRPQLYFDLGQASFHKEEYDQGLEYFRKAIALNPQPKESHFNLVVAGILAGQENLVQEELKIITAELGYELSARDYDILGRVYLQSGKLERAIEFLRQAVELSPASVDLRARLAAAYGEICDLENAQEQVQKTIEVNPNFALDGQQFLRELEEKCQQ